MFVFESKALRQAQCDSVQFISEVLRIKYKEICNSKSYCPAEPVEALSNDRKNVSSRISIQDSTHFHPIHSNIRLN